MRRTARTKPRRFRWAEYFVRKSGDDKVAYFQREGPGPKQYAEIVAYLRSAEGEPE
jgi:hypothetical protein